MALSATTPSGVLFIPGAYGEFSVVTQPTGVATSGILFLVGEADQGPDYASETTLKNTFYGPGDLGAIATKYGKGPLVDAARIAASAANDPDIKGAPQGFFLIKTNAPGKATLSLSRAGLTAYGALYDQNFGEPGNLISAVLTEAPAESAPSLQFTYIPAPNLASAETAVALRLNGGAVQTLSNIPEQSRPSAFVGTVASGSATGLNSLSDLLATGGQNRGALGGFVNTDTLAVTVSGSSVTITLGGAATAWATTPSVGDTLIIPAAGVYGANQASGIAGAGSANLGTYIVTAATATTITATKLRDDAALTVTAPVAVSATALATKAINSGSLSRTSNVVTATTTAPHGFTSGDIVYVQTTATGFAAGLKTITVTGSTTFTYAETGSNGTSDAAATVGIHYDILVFSPVTVKNMTGKARAILASANVGANVTGTASGATLTLTLGTGAWAVTPATGDLVYLPSTAPAAWHASGANGGYYSVASATSTTMVLTRLSNGNPTSFSATAIAATTDLVCKRPAIDGVGKSLEIYDGGDDISVANCFYTLGGVAVDWLSTSGSPKLNVSAAEQEINVVARRQSSSATEDMTAGGDIMLLVGYQGTTASLTLSATTLTTTVVGGVGANLNIRLKNYVTIGDLAAYIDAQPGYSCSPANNLLAQAKLFDADGNMILDKGTFTCASTHGNQALRLKRDAWSFFNTLETESQLVQLGEEPAPADAGLPEAQAIAFLAGGTRGSTSDADIVAALAALEKLRGNFVVPCFSRDAADDIADDATDSASTYTIASVHAASKSHVLKMSTFKARRNRQTFLAIDADFDTQLSAANDMASFRVAMAFETFKASLPAGVIDMPAWAGAVYAAAMQAGGFYRSIMGKGINTSGVLASDASFDPESDSQVETALKNGLLVARAREEGGYEWVSDQTTYAVDSNVIYNSIQAVYAADLVTLTVTQRMERAFKGQSLADVSAASAKGVFSAIMADLFRLKLISKSDDAPAGYKNLDIKIVGNVMYVSAEVKVSTSLAFIPISLAVSEIVQQAAA